MTISKVLIQNAESSLPESIFEDIEFKHINEDEINSIQIFTASFDIHSNQYLNNEIQYQKAFDLKLKDVFERFDRILNKIKEYCFFISDREFLVSVYQHNFNSFAVEFRGVVFGVVHYQNIDTGGKWTDKNIYEFTFEYYEHP